ncbi:MAG: FCD domain-containing protein [Rhizobiaceae bacterium]
MIYSAIEQNRTAKEVEQQIESLILEGVLRVNDKLPGERALSKAFSISRPILREALASLEKRGLLNTRHGGGTYTSDVIGTMFAPAIVELIGSNPKTKTDYLEYRREIEGMTAAMAAKRVTEADKTRLAQIMEAMEQAHTDEDAEREAAVDVEFHNAIGECAHNIILLHTLRSCYRLLSNDVFNNRELLYSGEGMRDKMLQQHKTIYLSVINGKVKDAKKAAQDHIIFIEQASREVERNNEWSAVSALRLAQRDEMENKKTRRKACTLEKKP